MREGEHNSPEAAVPLAVTREVLLFILWTIFSPSPFFHLAQTVIRPPVNRSIVSVFAPAIQCLHPICKSHAPIYPILHFFSCSGRVTPRCAAAHPWSWVFFDSYHVLNVCQLLLPIHNHSKFHINSKLRFYTNYLGHPSFLLLFLHKICYLRWIRTYLSHKICQFLLPGKRRRLNTKDGLRAGGGTRIYQANLK